MLFGDAEMNMGCLNGLTEVTVASMYGNKDCNRGRLGVIIPFSVSLSVTSFYGVVNVLRCFVTSCAGGGSKRCRCECSEKKHGGNEEPASRP